MGTFWICQPFSVCLARFLALYLRMNKPYQLTLFLVFCSICSSIYSQIIISPIQVQNITPSGFRVSWVNIQAANSSLKYGVTPNLELGTLSGGNVTNPNIDVSGGTASQVFYVQAIAQTGSTVQYSDTVVCITASNSSGDIKVYFNRSVNTAYANSPENFAKTLPNSIDDTLIAYINRAQTTIDLMVYNLSATSSTLSNIASALNTAHASGKKVRVIYNEDTGNTGLAQLNSGIPVLVSPVPSFPQYGLMHNKVFIFDALSSNPNRPVVWTGSTNLTADQINEDPNNVVIIQDQSLAKAYTMEFEEMWGSTTMIPSSANKRFGPDKRDNTPHFFNIGGRRVECYFSPSDGTNARIIKAITDATNDFTVNSMLITRSDIANVIIQQHNQGVHARILLNTPTEGGSSSQYALIEQTLGWRIMNWNSFNQGGTLHHKLVFANALGGSNPYVLTGSHNLSTAAEVRNDENTLVIYDGNIVNQYLQEFMGRLGAVASADYYAPFKSLTIYPNPTDNKLNINFVPDAGIDKVTLLNASGCVLKKMGEDCISTMMQIELNGYPSGVYFLEISAGGVIHIEKIILN